MRNTRGQPDLDLPPHLLNHAAKHEGAVVGGPECLSEVDAKCANTDDSLSECKNVDRRKINWRAR